MDDPTISLTLDKDRAIVLFDLLARWEGENNAPFPAADCFESGAEVRVLVDMLRDLEAMLVGPFSPDYSDLVGRARAHLADGSEDMSLRI